MKQTPLNWPYSLRPLRPPAARGGETPSEGFLLMKTTRFLAGSSRKVSRADSQGVWAGLSPLCRASFPGARLGHFSFSRENLVESEIDKPAEEVHEGVDGICGAEMQDARS